MWFATRAGLTHFPKRSALVESEGPKVLIHSVTIDKQRQSAEDFRELRPGPARLQFDYTALSLRNPASVFFKHRMEGVDRDWIDAGGHKSGGGSVRFANQSE